MRDPKKDKKKLLKVKKIKKSQRKKVTFYRKKKNNRKKLYNEQCLLFTPHNTNEFLIKYMLSISRVLNNRYDCLNFPGRILVLI